ncbi:hypothetical protein KFE25_008792 [Diacronema lutheri]|uniref:RNA helicase n=1 Tax=Diacronema lutheri TaxID=2081491 RepID=A0A8J5XWK2_DIALT|nr:hypothetical protein KFE25_008792 [Diacronema lutheri]
MAMRAVRTAPRGLADSALAHAAPDPVGDDEPAAVGRPAGSAGGHGAADVARKAADDGKAFREEHEVSVDGSLAGCSITPLRAFDDVVALLGSKSQALAKRAGQTFKELGYTAPSVIQAQSWPVTLEGRDCIGVSKTGSGKTMGFMLPAVTKVVLRKAELSKQRLYGPYVVVLAPTRELAQQIFAEAEKLTKPNGLGIVCTYGGESRNAQAMRVMRASRAKKFDVLVSTPGRLQDLLEDATVSLNGTQLLVLDEADRMLDMGFEPQIRAIAEAMPPPKERQTLLFSATWPKEVKHLALDFTHDALKVTIGSTDELSANRDITQRIVPLGGATRNKLEELLSVLKPNTNSDEPSAADDGAPAPADGARGGAGRQARYDDVPQTLVFANRKTTCDELESMLLDEHVRCSALHGDLSQRRRENVIEMFKAKRVNVLVATDVAARGLDIKGLDMVVNYDFPPALEDYVHRIGRTGRAGRKGVAVSFFGRGDAKLAPKLIELLRKHDQEVPAELVAMAPRGAARNLPERGRYGYTRRPVPHERPSRFGQRDGGRFGGRAMTSGKASYSLGPPVASLAPPGVCQLGEEWTACKLVDKASISRNVAVFTFALPDATKPLALSTCACILSRCKKDGEDVVRPYTPVSTNAQIGTFTLMVKVYPDGKMSQQMHHMPIGSTLDFKHIGKNVKVQYPFPKRRIGMIAGGTGITPFVQALHAVLGSADDDTRVSLLYGAQVEEDLLCKSTLDEWAAAYKHKFDVTYVLSNEPADSAWKGARGFVNAALCSAHLPAPSSDCLIFVCGPAPMYNALSGAREEPELKGTLAELGYKKEQVAKF